MRCKRWHRSKFADLRPTMLPDAHGDLRCPVCFQTSETPNVNIVVDVKAEGEPLAVTGTIVTYLPAEFFQ